MKHSMILCTVAVLALAGCATTPNTATTNEQSMGTTSQNGMTSQPATNTGNKPGSGMINSGGGLSQNMTPQEAAMAFRNMDTNSDGYVDKSEFTRYGDSGQRFNGCDSNDDGKLTLSEYVACSQRPASANSSGQ